MLSVESYAFRRKHKAACGGKQQRTEENPMALSYSLHLSAKGHALSTTGKIMQVSKHNLRSYKTSQSDTYNRHKVTCLVGNGSILADVRRIYKEEFDEALAEYNSQQRSDRRITDYLQHVSESKQQDVAVELILQIGDQDFWATRSHDRQAMVQIFRQQLSDLQGQVPELRIASAIVHDDESSPHMHIVAVPVMEYSRGLRKRVSKTKVFTRERLSKLQDSMRDAAEKEIQDVFPGERIAAKAEGRNKDVPKRSLAALREAEQAAEGARNLAAKAQAAADKAKEAEAIAQLSAAAIDRQAERELKTARQEYAAIKRQRQQVAEDVQKAQNQLSALQGDVKQAKLSLAEIEAERRAAEDALRKYNMEIPDDYEVIKSRAIDALLAWIPESTADLFRQGLEWLLQRRRETGQIPRRRPGAARRWPGVDPDEKKKLR